MGLFTSDVDYSGAENVYDQSMQKILAMLQEAQKQGRTDISDALKTSLGYNSPYMEAGKGALDQLVAGTTAKGQQSLMDQFQASPGYQYAIQQGQNAIQRKAAATGQNMSGAELRSLSTMQQGQANQDWNNWLTQHQQTLMGLAGAGQTAATNQSNYTMQSGNWLSNLGLQYSGMNTGIMSDMAKAKAEAMMAQETQNASHSWLSDIAGFMGGASGFLFGQPGKSGGSTPGAMDWLSKMFGNK